MNRSKKNRKINPFKILIIIIVLCLLIPIGLLAKDRIDEYLHPLLYEEYVNKYSEEFGVRKSLVYAVIKCESNFDPKALSDKNAYGLMQITKAALSDAVRQLPSNIIDLKNEKTFYNEEENIKYGIYILKARLNEFENDEYTAVAAYHTGQNRVKNEWLTNNEYSKDGKTLDSTPSKVTNHYVSRVLKIAEKYQKLYNVDD